jgi:hypothetical protein
MKRRVRWLLVRHGEHKDGHLTDEGKRQVRESVCAHLHGVAPDRLFASELDRACETALAAGCELSGENAFAVGDVIRDPGFGFAFPERLLLSDFPYPEANRRVQEMEATGEKVSVYDIFTIYWPPSLMIGGMLYKTMFEWSEGLENPEQSGDKEEFTCLVGTHGTMVYATLDPRGTPGNVGYGEIMEYVFEVEKGDARLVRSKLLTSTL